MSKIFIVIVVIAIPLSLFFAHVLRKRTTYIGKPPLSQKDIYEAKKRAEGEDQ